MLVAESAQTTADRLIFNQVSEQILEVIALANLRAHQFQLTFGCMSVAFCNGHMHGGRVQITALISRLAEHQRRGELNASRTFYEGPSQCGIQPSRKPKPPLVKVQVTAFRIERMSQREILRCLARAGP